MAADRGTIDCNAILDEIEELTRRTREIQRVISVDGVADDALWDELKALGDRITVLDRQYVEFMGR